MNPPKSLQDVPVHELEGTQYLATADLLKALGISRSTFYTRLKELTITPKRIKQSTYLTVKEAAELIQYSEFLSKGGNLQGWKDKQSALSIQVEQVELSTIEPEPEESATVDIESLRSLSEAAREGWWLPTGAIATLLDVSPGTISKQGQEFIALGFKFTRTEHKWKNSIQWVVRPVRDV